MAIISLLVTGFLWWFFFWQPPPMTYKEAYYKAHQRILNYCREMNYEPCDYKLVKVERYNSEDGSGIYLFESAYRRQISIKVDIGLSLLDSNLYPLK